jgi:hypothetical protein
MVVHPRQKANNKPKTLPSMTIAEIDEALTHFVLQNTANLHQEAPHGGRCTDPESAAQAATDVNALVRRVADTLLDQLDDAIADLRGLRDFLHSEGMRIQYQVSGFVKLNQVVRDIAGNVMAWKIMKSRPEAPQAQPDASEVLFAPVAPSVEQTAHSTSTLASAPVPGYGGHTDVPTHVSTTIDGPDGEDGGRPPAPLPNSGASA